MPSIIYCHLVRLGDLFHNNMTPLQEIIDDLGHEYWKIRTCFMVTALCLFVCSFVRLFVGGFLLGFVLKILVEL
jgi:hypothetical protein